MSVEIPNGMTDYQVLEILLPMITHFECMDCSRAIPVQEVVYGGLSMHSFENRDCPECDGYGGWVIRSVEPLFADGDPEAAVNADSFNNRQGEEASFEYLVDEGLIEAIK